MMNVLRSLDRMSMEWISNLVERERGGGGGDEGERSVVRMIKGGLRLAIDRIIGQRGQTGGGR